MIIIIHLPACPANGQAGLPDGSFDGRGWLLDVTDVSGDFMHRSWDRPAQTNTTEPDQQV